LPYEHYADGRLDDDKKTFMIRMQAANKVYGPGSAGAPFNIYAPGRFKNETVKAWSYAVKAGDTLTETWDIGDFENGDYHFRLYGPNGFYREFKGNRQDPQAEILTDVFKDTLRIRIKNKSGSALQFSLSDNAYGSKEFSVDVDAS
jgi:phospholipase C